MEGHTVGHPTSYIQDPTPFIHKETAQDDAEDLPNKKSDVMLLHLRCALYEFMDEAGPPTKKSDVMHLHLKCELYEFMYAIGSPPKKVM